MKTSAIPMTPATMSGMPCPSSMPDARGLRRPNRSVRWERVPRASTARGSGALPAVAHAFSGHQIAQTLEGPLHVPARLFRIDVAELQQDPLMVGGDVPALPDQRAPVDRCQFVAPDPACHQLAHGPGRTRLPGDTTV